MCYCWYCLLIVLFSVDLLLFSCCHCQILKYYEFEINSVSVVAIDTQILHEVMRISRYRHIENLKIYGAFFFSKWPENSDLCCVLFVLNVILKHVQPTMIFKLKNESFGRISMPGMYGKSAMRHRVGGALDESSSESHF